MIAMRWQARPCLLDLTVTSQNEPEQAGRQLALVRGDDVKSISSAGSPLRLVSALKPSLESALPQTEFRISGPQRGWSLAVLLSVLCCSGPTLVCFAAVKSIARFSQSLPLPPSVAGTP